MDADYGAQAAMTHDEQTTEEWIEKYRLPAFREDSAPASAPATATSTEASRPAPVLFGKAGERRSDSALLSDSIYEHLNDMHLANMAGLSSWAGDSTISSLYPMVIEHIHNIFTSKSMSKLFQGKGVKQLMMVKYCESRHWLQLLAIAPIKRVIYHNPYGGELGKTRIVRCFNISKGPLNGWSFESASVSLQSCTWECGAWEDWVSEVAADYVQGADYSLTFASYMQSRPEITPLNGLKSTALDRAKAKNNAFIGQRRCNARSLLQSADEQGLLPWGGAGVQIAAFSPSPSTISTPPMMEDDDSD